MLFQTKYYYLLSNSIYRTPQPLSHEGNGAVYGHDLCIPADALHYIDIGVRGGGAAIEISVPAHVLHVGGEIPPLEDHLAPSVKNGQGLDVVQAFASRVK